jgi:crotonobetainyl-CoA:carnitine CoA-transferase CaiB-like acyl-CoA transferase
VTVATPGALDGVRVVDLTVGIAGPLAAMLLADFGAEVVKVEGPLGDPARTKPGFAMWNRSKSSVVVDPGSKADRVVLETMLTGADVCVSNGLDGPVPAVTGADVARAANPGLVYLSMPAFLGAARWPGDGESLGLLWALAGLSLRQSSFEGGPIDPVFPYPLYLQAAWAAAGAVAALYERDRSGHGQIVTVGGMHAAAVAATSSLVIDPDVPEVPANAGPGGPHPMYTRYRCSDGVWIFLATLTPKFQRAALDVLGFQELLEDERIGGRLDAMLVAANRHWVRQRFTDAFASRTSDEWMHALRAADVPVGPVQTRDGWLDSPLLIPVGARVELEDPERGTVAMPGTPINLVATPARIGRPAPSLGGGRPDWSRRPRPAGTPTSGRPPLAGLRVLDLGTILAGPYAGTLLAELGADVIKVEVPAGDSWRERGMPYIRGQRGVAIDLRSPGGRRAFQALVRTADVVIDNYRAGVLRRLGIDYETLASLKSDIISVSITGFGEDSPFAGEPAFDPLLQARSGMMAAQGGDDEPVLLTVAVNDVTTAALSVLGTLLALVHRRRTGLGQKVWLSLAGTSTYAQCEELLGLPGRSGPVLGGRDFRGPSAWDRYYATADGWLRLEVPDRSSAGLRRAGVLDGAEPDDERELEVRLAGAFAGLGRDEAVDRLHAAGVRAAPARTLAELLADAEVEHAEVFDHLALGDTIVAVPGRYLRFSRSQHHESLRPPGVGEHTEEVLAEAGLDAAEIAELVSSGAVLQGSPMAYRRQVSYR